MRLFSTLRGVSPSPPEMCGDTRGGEQKLEYRADGAYGFFPPNAGSPEWALAAVGYSRRTGLLRALHPEFPSLSRGGAVVAAVNAELEHIWSRVQVQLATAVGEAIYRIWLEPLTVREIAH